MVRELVYSTTALCLSKNPHKHAEDKPNNAVKRLCRLPRVNLTQAGSTCFPSGPRLPFPWWIRANPQSHRRRGERGCGARRAVFLWSVTASGGQVWWRRTERSRPGQGVAAGQGRRTRGSPLQCWPGAASPARWHWRHWGEPGSPGQLPVL